MREMRKLLQQVDDIIYIKNTKLKYVEFLKGEWLDSKALKLRTVTLGTYKHNITKHIAPYFKKHEIGNITTQMIEKFYAHLSNSSRLSERSIQDIHKIIKSSFKTAVKRKYLSFSPAEEAQAPKVPSKEMMFTPKIRFHDLRHTVATLMLSRNINPKVVKEILGHSDIRVTLDTYSHVLPSVHKETAKKFGSMLFG